MSKNRITISVADARTSNNMDDVLVTYSLGSCIAICLYDPATHIGGMLHYQLPDSKMDVERAQQKPLMYADTGTQFLIDKMEKMGANKKRMKVKIAGGAAMNTGPKGFNIGKRNYLAARKIMWNNGMFIDAEDIGGGSPRNMCLNLENGDVTVRSDGLEKEL